MFRDCLYLNTGVSFGLIFLLMSFMTMQGCGGEDDYIPKPKAYPRVIYPVKAYQNYQPEDCPFHFEIPKYAKGIKDSLFFNKAPDNPCWMDVKFEDFNASVHISYKAVGKGSNELNKLINDAYKLNTKHVIRADFIEDSLINNPKEKLYGLFYEVGGNAATPNQFYLTDSSKHFIWASLYFNSTPNEDSIAPIASFIKKDLLHLLDTFEWE